MPAWSADPVSVDELHLGKNFLETEVYIEKEDREILGQFEDDNCPSVQYYLDKHPLRN